MLAPQTHAATLVEPDGAVAPDGQAVQPVTVLQNVFSGQTQDVAPAVDVAPLPHAVHPVARENHVLLGHEQEVAPARTVPPTPQGVQPRRPEKEFGAHVHVMAPAGVATVPLQAVHAEML